MLAHQKTVPVVYGEAGLNPALFETIECLSACCRYIESNPLRADMAKQNLHAIDGQVMPVKEKGIKI